MRKLILFFLSLTILFITPVANAANNSNVPKVTTLSASEVNNGDYFAFNNQVEIAGTVNGDVYTAGGTISITGKVNGDLLVAGGQVTISGEVAQDVRVAGGQVTITGKIGRNLSVGSGTVDLSSSASVGGSVVAGGGSVSLNGPIGGNVRVGAGSVVISNQVAGNVEAWVGLISLTADAKVGGNLSYWSRDDASLASGSEVLGKVFKNNPVTAEMPSREKILGALSGFAFFLKILSLFSLFAIGLVLIKFFPNFNQRVVTTLGQRPWASLGIGLLAAVLIPILSIVLLITVLGIPLGLSLLPLFFITIFFARVFTIAFLGNFILEKTGSGAHQVWALVVGIVVYGLLTMLPIIGGLVSFFTILFSFGALLIAKKDTFDLAREKKII